jgi:hypothetical protein
MGVSNMDANYREMNEDYGALYASHEQLLKALRLLVNKTYYKDHPLETELAYKAIENARRFIL